MIYLWTWFVTLLSGKPHFVIGNPLSPYMLRWWILPRNNWFGVYLHKFLHDDDDRALHDHPWWFISIMLKGGYEEYIQGKKLEVRRRSVPSIAFRRGCHKHRVVLHRDSEGRSIPCWTLVITGPRTRIWGFWCPNGFVPWYEFVKPSEHGQVGKGCD